MWLRHIHILGVVVRYTDVRFRGRGLSELDPQDAIYDTRNYIILFVLLDEYFGEGAWGVL